MKVICAWCRADLGEKEPLEGHETSHGICKDCKTTAFAIPTTKRERIFDPVPMEVRK
jgi:hypothetical protein